MNETKKLNRFDKGMNNVDQDTDLPEGSLREAINVDITRKGRVRRRKGYTEIYSGIGIHSLWERYFVESGTLKILLEDNSSADIVSGISTKHLSYCELLSTICFSNEDSIGTIDGPLSVPTIYSTPNLAIVSGTLKAGQYQVSFCNVSPTGEEGGATNPIVINVPDESGIEVSSIPLDGYDVRLFLSKPNGTALFEQVTIASTIPSVTLMSQRDDLTVCETLFMSEMPAGQIVREFKGRLYVAEGNTLWYSEAQRYGLCNLSHNFFQFSDRITVVQETENGIFVVADKTYFLPGNDPSQSLLTIVGKSKGVEGTGITTDAKNFSVDFNGKVAYWYSEKGVILGFPNGQIKYLTEDRYDHKVIATKGITGYREQDGIRQMITNLFEQNSEGSAFGASDNVTAQVIRNGVILN